ncbi:hypothetical protein CL616_00205 [archaeon]|nr:hypothetical protein [archaeon]|tara:strand:+ start:560 stop:1138 length:579 start_codon:yes stop_codon:yes gene_type:complete
MGNKKITKKARISVKKKRWYAVEAPKVLNNVVFGETLAADVSMLKGRGFAVNLSTVNRAVRGNNISVRFKISEVKGNNCLTDFIGYEMAGGFIKRLVKRAKRRVDDSFIVESKDKIKFRLKPMILVKAQIQHSVQTDLRKRVREHVAKLAKDKSYNEIVSMVLQGALQKELRSECRKVHPMLNVDIRALTKI